MTSQHISKTLVTLLLKANELRRQQNYQAALKLYLRALEQSEESIELLTIIAFCYLALAEPQKAVVWMEKAVALAPNNARLHADLAEYHSLGTLDYEQAAREYRKAIELNPNDIRALVGAAALYGVPEEVVTLDEAISWLERATQLKPDDPNYHARLGELYYKAGRLLDAEWEWLRALSCSRPLDPGYAQIIEVMLGTDND